MNAKDKKVLRGILRRIRGVSAHAASMDGEGNYVSNHVEAIRLMDSADYRKGYEYASQAVRESIKYHFGVEEDPGDKS